jgi:hypothetical protein
LAGFLVIHGDVRVRALASAGGALAHMGACAGRGQNITIHLYSIQELINELLGSNRNN